VLAFALLVLTGLSCPRQRKKDPLVDGFLFKEMISPTDGSYERWIEVYDQELLPQIPTATLNGKQLELTDWSEIHALYEDTFDFKSDTIYRLDVKHYWGEAWGVVHMPADFRMTRPDTNYVYNRDSILTVAWRSARGTTWYWLGVFVGYNFTDTLGATGYYEFGLDTVVLDTVCVFERNRFLPPNVRVVQNGWGAALTWACDGPQTEQGVEGNVHGHGFGYYGAANQCWEVDFYLGQHGASHPAPRELISDRREKLRRRFRIAEADARAPTGSGWTEGRE
jgi:hypothetical protein